MFDRICWHLALLSCIQHSSWLYTSLSFLCNYHYSTHLGILPFSSHSKVLSSIKRSLMPWAERNLSLPQTQAFIALSPVNWVLILFCPFITIIKLHVLYSLEESKLLKFTLKLFWISSPYYRILYLVGSLFFI